MELKRTWTLIIPVYNEEGNIKEVLEKAHKVLSEITKEFNILVVDDGSTDSSEEIIKEIANKIKKIRIIRHPSNLGIGHAVWTGYNNADGDLIGVIPADLQFDPNDLKLFLPFIDKSDVIVCFRPGRNDSIYRKFVTSVDHFLVKLLYGLSVKDLNWVKIYKKWILDRVDLKSKSPFIETELLVKAKNMKAVITEVPAPYYKRVSGKARGASLYNVCKSFFDLLILWKELKWKD